MERLLVHAACAAPLAWLVWLGAHAGLSANPVEFVTHRTGDWALNLLLATLCCSPLDLKRFRRAVGLWCFAYACLHFLTWLWLDKEFDAGDMLADVGKRRFITAGFAALVLMLPLAITSTTGWIKRLGKNWVKLHRLVYPAAILGVIHYAWLVKKDERWPMTYAAALAALLGWRLWTRVVKKRLQTP